METKQCTKCGEVKELSEFHKKRAGHASRCKDCKKEYDKEYNKTNADKKKEHNKEYYKTNADACTLNLIRNRARRKGIHFDLELKDILGVTHCPVFGWELKRSQGKAQSDSPSVDRKIPELGYVKGNIQILSQKANTMKQDATPEELIQFAEWILRTYQK